MRDRKGCRKGSRWSCVTRRHNYREYGYTRVLYIMNFKSVQLLRATPSLSLALALSFARSLAFSLSRFIFRSLALACSFARSLSFSLARSLAFSLSRFFSIFRSLARFLSLSLFLYRSFVRSLSFSIARSFARSLSFSLALSLSLVRSLARSLVLSRSRRNLTFELLDCSACKGAEFPKRKGRTGCFSSPLWGTCGRTDSHRSRG